MSEQAKLNEEKVIQEWELLFPSPEEAQKVKSIADLLLKTGLGKRKVKKNGQYTLESDLEYMMRVQYCVACNIPLCFINQTYILEGGVHRMVEVKMWAFKKSYPNAEFQVICCNKTKMIKQGRISPEHNWVRVEWTLEKAKALRLYHKGKAQWAENIESMFNARCNGQLVDILGGLEAQGSGYMSTEEINSLGIDIKEEGA